MKSKLILISICLLFITNAFSQETYYYIKGEKHYLTNISTKRILMEFEDDLTISEKNDVIREVNSIVDSPSKKSDIIRELDDDKQQSSNDKYIIHLAESSEKDDVILLVNTLRNDDDVKYANYYFYNKEDGGEMHTYYNEVILKFKPKTTIEDLVALSEKYNFEIIGKRQFSNDKYSLKVLKETNTDAAELSRILWETDMFVFSEPAIRSVLIKNNKQEVNTDDPMYNMQWGLKNISNAMYVEDAWEYSTGEDVIVAVLDDGVDLDHYDLTENILRDDYGNIVGHDCHPEDGVIPGSYSGNDSHGTNCAGCFGAVSNTIGIAGVAFDCKIMPVRIAKGIPGNPGEVDVDWPKAALALSWAMNNGAEVISISIGSDTYNSYFAQECWDVNDIGRGYLGLPIVVAAGNRGEEQGHSLDFPADLGCTIAVGALDKNKKRASFSSYFNGWVDVVAPGVDIVTTKINSQYTHDAPIEGTSFSAPYVAGIFALMFSLDEYLDYEDAKELLFTKCSKNYIDYNWQYEYPYGDWNRELGYGWPNARAIVEELYTSPPPPPSDICYLNFSDGININGDDNINNIPCISDEEIELKPIGLENCEYWWWIVNKTHVYAYESALPYYVNTDLCCITGPIHGYKWECEWKDYFLEIMEVDENLNQIGEAHSDWFLLKQSDMGGFYDCGGFPATAAGCSAWPYLNEQIVIDEEELNHLQISFNYNSIYKIKLAKSCETHGRPPLWEGGEFWNEGARYFRYLPQNIVISNEVIDEEVEYVAGNSIRILPETILESGKYWINSECDNSKSVPQGKLVEIIKPDDRINEYCKDEDNSQVKSTTFVIESPENNKITDIETQDYKREEFKVIPNPFDNTFELVFSDNIKPNRFEIINISGEIIYSEQLLNEKKKRVNGKLYSRGVYFIRVYTDKGVLYKKIIKK